MGLIASIIGFLAAYGGYDGAAFGLFLGGLTFGTTATIWGGSWLVHILGLLAVLFNLWILLVGGCGAMYVYLTHW
jgi:hypothetical protein